MTEDSALDQPQEPAEVAPAKSEPKKQPSFRRVVANKPDENKLVEAKQPSFRRVDKLEETAAITTVPVLTPAVVVQKLAATASADVASIASLVEIRNHVNALVNGNFTIAKDKMKDLQKVSLLMDRKIVDMVLSSEFKTFVNFQDANKAVQEAAKNNTITNHPLRNPLYG